jgi:hypothetical protein
MMANKDEGLLCGIRNCVRREVRLFRMGWEGGEWRRGGGGEEREEDVVLGVKKRVERTCQ